MTDTLAACSKWMIGHPLLESQAMSKRERYGGRLSCSGTRKTVRVSRLLSRRQRTFAFCGAYKRRNCSRASSAKQNPWGIKLAEPNATVRYSKKEHEQRALERPEMVCAVRCQAARIGRPESRRAWREQECFLAGIACAEKVGAQAFANTDA